MKLLHETPNEYIQNCRNDVKFYTKFVEDMQAAFDKHKSEGLHTDCELCLLFSENIDDNEGFLRMYTERLNRARKGIYD